MSRPLGADPMRDYYEYRQIEARDARKAKHHHKHNGGHMPRYRATALIIKGSKVLLVKDRGRHDYSMPGGGFKHKESTIQAGIREISEELGLRTTSAVRLRHCDLKGRRANHRVVLLTVEGTPHIDHKELKSYIWWDMKCEIPIQGHVKYILSKWFEPNH